MSTMFGLFPFLFSLAASFTDYSPLRGSAPHVIGLRNYSRALHDSSSGVPLSKSGQWIW